mgnify:CR=1 FL=1
MRKKIIKNDEHLRKYECQDCGNSMFIDSYLIMSRRKTGVPVCTGCGGRFWEPVSKAGKKEVIRAPGRIHQRKRKSKGFNC